MNPWKDSGDFRTRGHDKLNARIRVLESLCDGLEAVLGPDERPISSGKQKQSKKGGKRKPTGKRKGR